jgi:hypothetical protein
MDYDKMTKAQLLRELKKNEVLSPVKEMTDITFGHVQMVENIGKALAGKHHMFGQIINSCYVDGNLTITLPSLKKVPTSFQDPQEPGELVDCDGICDACEHGNMIGECAAEKVDHYAIVDDSSRF